MSLYTNAVDKLAATYKDVNDRYGAVMKASVREALINFARQDDEFAGAIVDGGSFKDCMAAVCKGVGQSISDLDAYSRAASFYFPGCKVKFEMHIDLIGDAAEARAEDFKPVVLSLEDFI